MPPKKTTSKRKTGLPKKMAKPKSDPPPYREPVIASAISPYIREYRTEIIGLLLALLGGFTVLSMAYDSSITDAWFRYWRMAFGWAAFLLPFLSIAVGVWVIFRNNENFPILSIERILGLVIGVLSLLALMHTTLAPKTQEAAYLYAQSGIGGGYLGGWLMWLLQSRLGILGTGIAMLATLIIGLTMALDVSVVDLFRWVKPMLVAPKEEWDESEAYQPQPDNGYFDFDALDDYRQQETPDFSSYQPPQPSAPSTPPAPVVEFAKQPAAITEENESPTTSTLPPREWTLPAVAEMLNAGSEVSYNQESDRTRAQVIEETLASFGAPAHVVEINRGPTITQFGVEPDFIETRSGRTRVRVGKITSLADDLTLALAASRIRIQAPVPGKGFVGIEVPNDEIAVVSLRDVLESKAFSRLKSPLRFALGQDVAGNAVAADLAGMPHLLVAGATGSGKSVFVNAMITGFLLNNTPATLRMIMVDPKRVELTGYNGVPHLMAPVVTEVQRVVGVLQWVTREMDSRYQKFADIGARNLVDFNKQVALQGGTPLPYLVLVIDELADLMMIAPDQTERLITRMAQLARATGIHLVISTQRPSVDVVTGLIKANFPARISFAVASGTDSRVILDQPGAERLLGRGDMLFQAPDAAAPTRLQGVYVSDPEIQRIVQYWRAFAGTTSTAPVPTSTPVDAPPQGVPLKQMPIWEEMEEEEEQDNMYDEAVSLVRRKGRASISMLQRRLRIGYTRSARLIDQMEADGIIGPATGSSTPREVVDYGQAAPPADED